MGVFEKEDASCKRTFLTHPSDWTTSASLRGFASRSGLPSGSTSRSNTLDSE